MLRCNYSKPGRLHVQTVQRNLLTEVRRTVKSLMIVWIMLSGLSKPVAAQTEAVVKAATGKQHEFFEKQIRPLLVRHCYECHSGASNEIKGGLRLDSREAAQHGGDSGPAVVPGKADESLLLSAVRHEGMEMPPGRKLSEPEIQALTEWIESGAFDPRDHPPEAGDVASETFEALYQDRRQWWSLQPIKSSEPPLVDSSSSLNDIDRFIVAKLREKHLDLAPIADQQTLARRACFAVTGLPPTESQREQFSAGADSESWEQFVDELLASAHFGERWARHWMDVVRYTDTYGYE